MADPIADFDDFLGAPPSDIDRLTVRDYRHMAYWKWKAVVAEIQRLRAENAKLREAP